MKCWYIFSQSNNLQQLVHHWSATCSISNKCATTWVYAHLQGHIDILEQLHRPSYLFIGCRCAQDLLLIYSMTHFLTWAPSNNDFFSHINWWLPLQWQGGSLPWNFATRFYFTPEKIPCVARPCARSAERTFI